MISDVNINSTMINNSINNPGRGISEGSRADANASVTNIAAEGYANNTGISGGADAAIEQALEDAGLPRTERNINTARQMLQNQLPLSRDNLRSVTTQINMYREADISSIIMMNKYDIPVTRFTATQFQAYLNNEQQLTAQVDGAIASILDLFSDGGAEAAAFNEQLLEILTDGAVSGAAGGYNADTLTTTAASTAVVAEEIVNAADPESAGTTDSEMSSGQLYAGVDGAAAAGLSGSSISPDAALANGIASFAQGMVYGTTNEIQAEVDGSGTDVFNGFGGASSGLGDTGVQSGNEGAGSASGSASASVGSEAVINNINDILTLSTVFTEEELEGLRELMVKNDGYSSDTSVNEALQQLKQQLPDSSNEQLDSLLKSPLYQKLIKHAVSNKLSMTPEELRNGASINEFYKETYMALNKMHEAAAANEKLSEALSKPMDNLKFMDTINNLFPYIQLPLTLHEGKTHGELYVFKNGRTRSESGEAQSVLLHLDMDNLGPTDIHMELKNRCLKLHFYADNQLSLNVISDNYSQLSQALESKNYQLVSELEVRNEQRNVLTEVLERDSSQSPAFQYSFDIRA